MKYQVIYFTNKKKKKTATFFNVEDASRWEDYIRKQGYVDSEIIPIFS